MSAATILLKVPGYRVGAMLALTRVFAEHGERDVWQALRQFNKACGDE